MLALQSSSVGPVDDSLIAAGSGSGSGCQSDEELGFGDDDECIYDVDPASQGTPSLLRLPSSRYPAVYSSWHSACPLAHPVELAGTGTGPTLPRNPHTPSRPRREAQ